MNKECIQAYALESSQGGYIRGQIWGKALKLCGISVCLGDES